MSWASIKRRGSGKMDFRLCVAGWPHEWTTSPRITHANGADGRRVFPTLKYDDLKISERLSLRQAWPEIEPLTFTLVASTPQEETLNGFTRDVLPIGTLTVAMDAEGFSDVATLDTSGNLAAGVYHIGTEALRSAGGNSLQRAIWDTVLEAHPVTTFGGRKLKPMIFDWPPTMDGRRVTLYVYGEGDDGAGAGTAIWRGVVVTPPRMAADGITWEIGCDPITTVFEQEVAASDAIEYRVRGIYHSWQNPFCLAYRAAYTDDSHQVTSPNDIIRRITGFHETQSEFVFAVNQAIKDMILARKNIYGLSELLSAQYEESGPQGPTITVNFNRNEIQTNPDLTLFEAVWFPAHGILEGAMVEGVSKRHVLRAATYVLGVVDQFGDSTGAFFLENVTSDLAPWGYPLPNVRAMFGPPPLFASTFNNNSGQSAGIPAIDATAAAQAAWPADRIYLNRVDGLRAGDYLFARNNDSAIPLRVEGVFQQPEITGQPGNYITVAFKQQPKGGGPLYFDNKTTLVPLRVYASGGSLADFLAGAIAASPNANDGDTPFVLDKDVNAASLAALFADGSGIDSYWYQRIYAYTKPVSLKNIIRPELQLTGLMARLEVDGRLGFAKLPQFTSGKTPVGTITDADSLPPARGMAGMFPKWESQPEGLVNIVDIKVGYKPYEDGYDDAYTFNFKLEDSVALHKSLGRGSETIEVKSMAASGTPSNIAPTDIILFGQAPGAVSAEKAAAWSRRYLAILAIEYSLVTIAVPFKFFDLLVGDVVEVTHQYIPNGQGGRGVVSKKACIVRRRWNLDPQQPEMGELTLYFPRYVPAGYTPSGMITGYTSLGGNTWRLTFNQLNDFNKAWSENDDGNVLKHFAAGDLIRVIQYGVSVPVVVTGTVSSVDAGSPFSTSLVVAMDSALSTSGNRVLMWRSTQAALTTRQKSYCYVATANRNLPTGYARLYL